jgi:iron(III) transport system substrate-binding protein
MDDRIFEWQLSRREALRLGLTGGVALGIAACGGAAPASATIKPSIPAAAAPTSALVKAAQAEGALTFYTATALTSSAQVAGAFTGAYGIPVSVQRLVSAPLEVRFTAEMQAGKPVADLIQLSDTAWLNSTGIPKGWLATPDTSEIPAANGWPAKYILGNTAYLQNTSIEGIGYNTDLVKGRDVPTKWTDLLNPKWKGSINMTDPRSNNVVLSWCLLMDQTYGDSFLTKLGQQNLQLDAGGGGPAALAAGSVAIQIISSQTQIGTLQAAGAPVKCTAFDAPTVGAEEWTALVKGAPHPNAAKLFFNFALSVPGQIAACKSLCSSVLVAPGTINLPKQYQSPPIDQAISNRARLLGLMGLK